MNVRCPRKTENRRCKFKLTWRKTIWPNRRNFERLMFRRSQYIQQGLVSSKGKHLRRLRLRLFARTLRCMRNRLRYCWLSSWPILNVTLRTFLPWIASNSCAAIAIMGALLEMIRLVAKKNICVESSGLSWRQVWRNIRPARRTITCEVFSLAAIKAWARGTFYSNFGHLSEIAERIELIWSLFIVKFLHSVLLFTPTLSLIWQKQFCLSNYDVKVIALDVFLTARA